MEIRNLITFLKISELNSFSKAANALNYAQSTVTTQIQMLENELEVRLFDRVGKTIRLTQKGQQLLSHAKVIVNEIHCAKRVMDNDITAKGELRIGVFESICGTFLPDMIKQYEKHCPNVRTSIQLGNLSEMSILLNSNQIDFMWIFDHSLTTEQWIKAYEKEYPIVFVAADKHPLAQLEHVCISDFENERFILTDHHCSYRKVLEDYFGILGINPNIYLEMSNTEVIKKFILSNLGIGFLPQFLVQDMISQGALSILQPIDFSPLMYSQLFYHKNKWLSLAEREFIRLLTGHTL